LLIGYHRHPRQLEHHGAGYVDYHRRRRPRLISYYDFTDQDLKVAHCTDTACSTAVIVTLDSSGDTGRLTSVTIGADGLGIISYYKFTNGDLKVAHCASLGCLPNWRRR
jgi:hypothetical protein